MFDFNPEFTWSTAVQILGFVVAIGGVMFQLNRQRKLQQEQYLTELQLGTYEKIAENIESSSPTGVTSSLQILCAALDTARTRVSQHGKYLPPPFRAEKFNDDFSRVHAQLWRVAATIEKYEIVAECLPLFREVLVKKIRELGDAYLPILTVLPHVLVSENGIVRPEDLVPLRDADLAALEEKINSFEVVAYDLAGFLYDIQVELQNSLLGPFFKRKLALRQPADEEALVLTSNDQSMIDRAKEYTKAEDRRA